jgi:hypothetical protein
MDKLTWLRTKDGVSSTLRRGVVQRSNNLNMYGFMSIGYVERHRWGECLARTRIPATLSS